MSGPTASRRPSAAFLTEHLDAEGDITHGNLSDTDHESEAEHLEAVFKLTLQLHNKPVEIPIYYEDATIQDLSDIIAEDLSIPPANQKFLVSPKVGLLKHPFKNPELPLRSIQEKKIVLIGATSAEVAELESDIAERRERVERRRNAQQSGRRVKAYRNRDWKKVQDEASYTFHALRPLPHLPNPEKSLRFLERLRDDAGIKASMRKHGFSVGLLTEMDPAMHTTHESRTLGLNRNRGEVIELRLRTDAYDGYRDYKVIRKTLCHELAHNVWGEHDEHFWKLCREIEAQVDKNDWRRGGQSVGAQEFYNPDDEGEDEEADGGGWTGGEFVLGGGEDAGKAALEVPGECLSRREITARAAEERMRKEREAKSLEQKAKDASKK